MADRDWGRCGPLDLSFELTIGVPQMPADGREAIILGVPTMSDVTPEVRAAHWAKTKSLTITVLVIWFIFSIVVHWFADALNAISFLGFPLGFYMAAQGSLIIFVILIFYLAYRQNKIDEEFGVAEEDQ
jgi:putative solute:sodium symporter small subunit